MGENFRYLHGSSTVALSATPVGSWQLVVGSCTVALSVTRVHLSYLIVHLP